MASRGKRQTDVVFDGYCWAKYGQKALLLTSFLRSYYRCAFRSGSKYCPARKYVDQHLEDPHEFRIAYQGTHVHPRIYGSKELYEDSVLDPHEVVRCSSPDPSHDLDESSLGPQKCSDDAKIHISRLERARSMDSGLPMLAPSCSSEPSCASVDRKRKLDESEISSHVDSGGEEQPTAQSTFGGSLKPLTLPDDGNIWGRPAKKQQGTHPGGDPYIRFIYFCTYSKEGQSCSAVRTIELNPSNHSMMQLTFSGLHCHEPPRELPKLRELVSSPPKPGVNPLKPLSSTGKIMPSSASKKKKDRSGGASALRWTDALKKQGAGGGDCSEKLSTDSWTSQAVSALSNLSSRSPDDLLAALPAHILEELSLVPGHQVPGHMEQLKQEILRKQQQLIDLQVKEIVDQIGGGGGGEFGKNMSIRSADYDMDRGTRARSPSETCTSQPSSSQTPFTFNDRDLSLVLNSALAAATMTFGGGNTLQRQNSFSSLPMNASASPAYSTQSAPANMCWPCPQPEPLDLDGKPLDLLVAVLKEQINEGKSVDQEILEQALKLMATPPSTIPMEDTATSANLFGFGDLNSSMSNTNNKVNLQEILPLLSALMPTNHSSNANFYDCGNQPGTGGGGAMDVLDLLAKFVGQGGQCEQTNSVPRATSPIEVSPPLAGLLGALGLPPTKCHETNTSPPCGNPADGVLLKCLELAGLTSSPNQSSFNAAAGGGGYVGESSSEKDQADALLRMLSLLGATPPQQNLNPGSQGREWAKDVYGTVSSSSAVTSAQPQGEDMGAQDLLSFIKMTSPAKSESAQSVSASVSGPFQGDKMMQRGGGQVQLQNQPDEGTLQLLLASLASSGDGNLVGRMHVNNGSTWNGQRNVSPPLHSAFQRGSMHEDASQACFDGQMSRSASFPMNLNHPMPDSQSDRSTQAIQGILDLAAHFGGHANQLPLEALTDMKPELPGSQRSSQREACHAFGEAERSKDLFQQHHDSHQNHHQDLEQHRYQQQRQQNQQHQLQHCPEQDAENSQNSSRYHGESVMAEEPNGPGRGMTSDMTSSRPHHHPMHHDQPEDRLRGNNFEGSGSVPQTNNLLALPSHMGHLQDAQAFDGLEALSQGFECLTPGANNSFNTAF